MGSLSTLQFTRQLKIAKSRPDKPMPWQHGTLENAANGHEGLGIVYMYTVPFSLRQRSFFLNIQTGPLTERIVIID